MSRHEDKIGHTSLARRHPAASSFFIGFIDPSIGFLLHHNIIIIQDQANKIQMNSFYMHRVALASSNKSSDEDEEYSSDEDEDVHPEVLSESRQLIAKLRYLANEVNRLRRTNETIFDTNNHLKAKVNVLSKTVDDLRSKNIALRKQNETPMKKVRSPKKEPSMEQCHSVSRSIYNEVDLIAASRGSSGMQVCSVSRSIDTLTNADLLYHGLRYAGFDAARQQNVKLEKNIERFKYLYGSPPTSVIPMFVDLRNDHPDMAYKDCLMAMNWLYLYDTYPVLSARWKLCEEKIGPTVLYHGKLIANLVKKKIQYRFKHKDLTHKLTVDGVIFNTNEFWLDPSSEWYNPKGNCAGIVSSSWSKLLYWENLTLSCSFDHNCIHRNGNLVSQSMNQNVFGSAALINPHVMISLFSVVVTRIKIKKNGIKMLFISGLRKEIKPWETVATLASQAKLSPQKMSILPTLKSFWHVLKIVRRHFIGVSRHSISLAIDSGMERVPIIE